MMAGGGAERWRLAGVEDEGGGAEESGLVTEGSGFDRGVQRSLFHDALVCPLADLIDIKRSRFGDAAADDQFLRAKDIYQTGDAGPEVVEVTVHDGAGRGLVVPR